MRKISVLFVVLFVLFIVTLTASAQQRIGFIGGLNLANATGRQNDEDLDFSNRLGIGLGGVLELTLNRNIGSRITTALRLEPMYLQNGGRLREDGILESSGGDFIFVYDELKVNVSNFEVPVLIKFALGTINTSSKGGSPQFYFLAGPTLALILSSEIEVIDASGSGLELDIVDLTSSIAFGLGLGNKS